MTLSHESPLELYIDGTWPTARPRDRSFTPGTPNVANGSHALLNKAHDAVGNVSTSSTVMVTVGNSGRGQQQLIGNPGFENGSGNPAPWVATSGRDQRRPSRAAALRFVGRMARWVWHGPHRHPLAAGDGSF